MLDNDEIRFACDDARLRNAAIVDLIHQGDRTALELAKFYIAIASAAISASAAIFFATGHVPRVFGIVLIGLAVPLLAGAQCCFVSMWTATMHLPGRGADFWLWAMRPEVESKSVFEAYLKRLDDGHATNRALNTRMAKWLDYAKRLGVLAPFVALVCLFFGFAARI